MERDRNNLIPGWLSLTNIYTSISTELETALQKEHDLTLKEFYMLLFLSESPDKKLKLQQLQQMVGLSQSAMSRLVARFEARGCGALQRETCQNDRRNIYTSLTKLGEDKLENAKVSFNKILRNSFDEGIQDVLKALLLNKTK